MEKSPDMWEWCGEDKGVEGKGEYVLWGRMKGLSRLKRKKAIIQGGLEGCAKISKPMGCMVLGFGRPF